MNVITPSMDDQPLDAWNQINADPEIWCAVLSAAGEKAFCIGADVSEAAERKSRMALAGGLTGIGGPWIKLKKPLITAVQGFCVGGFELAMCADMIVAADTAQFGLPETKVGIVGECGVVHRSIRQLPHHIAMAMILTGERDQGIRSGTIRLGQRRCAVSGSRGRCLQVGGKDQCGFAAGQSGSQRSGLEPSGISFVSGIDEPVRGNRAVRGKRRQAGGRASNE